MATAAVEERDSGACFGTSLDDRHGWGLALLLAVVATLFLRPADLVPALEGWPIYQFLIVSCLVVSVRATSRQLAHRALGEQTVTLCLLILLLSVGVSHLAHGFLWAARMSMYDVGKQVVFYLLIVGLINTPYRLVFFVRWLVIAITVVAVLVLLDRANVISVAALEPIQSHAGQQGSADLIERIRGTGIFQDPNDFGLILVMGLVFSASFFFRPNLGWPRYLWLIPAIVLLMTLRMTHSRGALISLIAAFPALFAFRRGWKIGALSLLLIPLLTLVFSSRMTDVTAMNSGTGQSRIQVWSDSLVVFQRYPVFGLGAGLLVEENGVVAHNSFLHCYAELGFLGGTAFLGCFLAAGLGLWSLRDRRPSKNAWDEEDHDAGNRERQELGHVRGFMFAALVAYTAGMLTLSRQFVTPTYLVLGLATATYLLARSDARRHQVGKHFLPIVVLASITTIIVLQLFVRLFVRW